MTNKKKERQNTYNDFFCYVDGNYNKVACFIEYIDITVNIF